MSLLHMVTWGQVRSSAAQFAVWRRRHRWVSWIAMALFGFGMGRCPDTEGKFVKELAASQDATEALSF